MSKRVIYLKPTGVICDKYSGTEIVIDLNDFSRTKVEIERVKDLIENLVGILNSCGLKITWSNIPDMRTNPDGTVCIIRLPD